MLEIWRLRSGEDNGNLTCGMEMALKTGRLGSGDSAGGDWARRLRLGGSEVERML